MDIILVTIARISNDFGDEVDRIGYNGCHNKCWIVVPGVTQGQYHYDSDDKEYNVGYYEPQQSVPSRPVLVVLGHAIADKIASKDCE